MNDTDIKSEVLTGALLHAIDQFGLNHRDTGSVFGMDHAAIANGALDLRSRAGDTARRLVRCYRGLFVLAGGDLALLDDWMCTHNHHTGGIPATQVKSRQGLARLTDYLDAIHPATA